MKGFEKFILVVFSIIIIVLVVGAILVSSEMLKSTQIVDNLESILTNNKILIILIGAVLVMFGLVGIFSGYESDENVKSGLAIKHENGTVYITRETFESIVLNVARDFASLKNVKVSVEIDETGVSSKIYAYILPDTIVPVISEKLQQSVKEAIQKQTTVDIKEVDVKIKGVYVPIEKK